MSNIWVDLHEGRVFRDRVVRNRSGEYVAYSRYDTLAYYIKPQGKNASVKIGIVDSKDWSSFTPQELEVLYRKVFEEIVIKDVNKDNLFKACIVLHRKFMAYLRYRKKLKVRQLQDEIEMAAGSGIF